MFCFVEIVSQSERGAEVGVGVFPSLVAFVAFVLLCGILRSGCVGHDGHRTSQGNLCHGKALSSELVEQSSVHQQLHTTSTESVVHHMELVPRSRYAVLLSICPYRIRSLSQTPIRLRGIDVLGCRRSVDAVCCVILSPTSVMDFRFQNQRIVVRLYCHDCLDR